jgi:hypothetical protein
MIKNLKILTWFIYDLLKVRKNDLHINKNSSYQVMRTLYRISNGLITNLIGYFLSGLKYKNSNKFKNGYLELEKISKDEVQSLKKEISKMRVFDQRKINNYNYLDIEKKVSDYAFEFNTLKNQDIIRLDVLKSDLLSNKIIAEFVTNKKWVSVVKKILNVEPKLVDITSWYTLPHKNEIDLNQYSAQIWHRDVDKIRDLKIFIYLSDVETLENGPFEIIPNSHTISLNKITYENKNNFRIYDDKIKNKKIYSRYSFLGHMGSNFIVDTRCLHRGKIVKNKFRQIIELYFSNSSFGKHEYFNEFSRPRLNSSWDSYEIWNNKINNNPQNYNSLFLGKKSN